MGNIAENLLALQQTKEDFKTSFESKGVDLTDVPFTEYPNKLEELKEDLDAELTEQESALEELESAVNGLSDKDDTALKILDGTLEEFDNKQWGLTSLREQQFKGFLQLKKIDLTGITNIPKYAFQDCEFVEQVVLDSHTSYIGLYGFNDFGYKAKSCLFDVEIDGECVLSDYAFHRSGLSSIKGSFNISLNSPLYMIESLHSVDVDSIGSANNTYLFAECPNITLMRINFDRWTGKTFGTYNFFVCGTNRPNPENNVFVFDLRNNTQMTTLGSYSFAGKSGAINKYFRCFLPHSLITINKGLFGWSEGMVVHFTSITPPTLNINFFTNSTNYKIFVPHNSINAYKVATNWAVHSDYIYGWAEENTFEQGAVLPTTSDEGLTLTWYSDENLTTPVTSVDDATKMYYCVGV